MGIFSNVKHWQIKSFTKGACRAMLTSFLVFEDQMKKGKIEANLFSDLAARALSTRPGWKMIAENTFERKIGERIKINKEDTLADVSLSVILIEMQEFILNDNNPEEIFSLILTEFQKIFSISDEKMEKMTEKNKIFSSLKYYIIGRSLNYRNQK